MNHVEIFNCNILLNDKYPASMKWLENNLVEKARLLGVQDKILFRSEGAGFRRIKG